LEQRREIELEISGLSPGFEKSSHAPTRLGIAERSREAAVLGE